MRRHALPLLLAAGLLLLQPGTGAQAPEPRAAYTPAELIDCRFYDETLFRRAVATRREYEIDPPLLGILPHHDVAGELAAAFFRAAAARQVDTVVLLGPNHSGIGPAIATTRKGYRTPRGDLPCDRGVTDRLLALPGVAVQDDLMRQDHAVQALLPLVAHYFPEAEVVTLLLLRTPTQESLAALAATLAELAGEGSCLIVGSIDFSHGLQPQEAARNDAQTAALIRQGELPRLMQLGNEHLDAPAVLSVLLQLSQLCDRELTLLHRADAPDYVPPPWPEGVTGYLVYGG